jgi:anaerobic selenocysteine-containing dehydrogenase
LIEPKLASKNSLVVTLSPYLSELARRSDYVIPTTAHMESLTDIPTPFDARTATFALGVPIMQPPTGVLQPIDVINQLSSGIESLEQHLKQKAEAIHKSRRGTIFNFADGSSTPNSTIASADDLWKRLNEGAIWIDSPRKQAPPKTFSFLGHVSQDRFQKSASTYTTIKSQSRNEKNIILIPYGFSAAVGSGQLSPLMSKLYQESNLRRGKHSVSMHPSSGAGLDLNEGDKAIMSTSKGACEVSVHFDSAVMPGIGLVSVGPDPVDFVKNGTRLTDGPLDIVEINGTTWNATSAILRKA